MSINSYLDSVKEVLRIESESILNLIENLDSQFSEVIDNILATKGRVIVCGMGKSGIIAKKISATLASTGTPSFFLHPAEAYHGDLGMVTKDDIFIGISNSGETTEIIKLIPFMKSNGNYFVSMTGQPNSTLAKNSNHHLNTSVKKEACPLNLTPTCSTTATLALGDALAITLMKARDFKPENFAKFHPGGNLGRKLLAKVEDEMITENLPIISGDLLFFEVLKKVTEGGLGLVIIQDKDQLGIITDGDLRRVVEKHKGNVFVQMAKNIMSMNPKTIERSSRVEEAFRLMDIFKISSILVKDNDEVVGILKK